MNAKASPEKQTLFHKWLIEDIVGRGLIDNAQTTIQIAEDGSVSGSTGVNRYCDHTFPNLHQMNSAAPSAKSL